MYLGLRASIQLTLEALPPPTLPPREKKSYLSTTHPCHPLAEKHWATASVRHSHGESAGLQKNKVLFVPPRN